MCFRSSDAGSQARTLQQQQQKQIEDATSQINTAFQGFNAPFYQQKAQAYEDYAMPQFQEQYQTTANQLGFQLANQGLTKGSSQAQQLGEALGQEASTQKQNIANQGISQAQSLQQQIEQERSGLIGQANAASDPLSIAGQAVGQAAQFSAPSTFGPIGQLFGNFANAYLGKQYASAYGTQYPYNYGYGYGANLGGRGGSLPSAMSTG